MARRSYPAGVPGESTLIRIGRGVPGSRPPQRKLKPPVYWVLAAAVLIAVSALVVVVYFLDPPTGSPSAAATTAIDNRIECANITHAYNNWWPGREDLTILSHVAPDVAEHLLKNADEHAAAFADATVGYADYPSRDLALALLEYRSQLDLLIFQQGTQHVPDETLVKKTLDAWDAAGEKYRTFIDAAGC